MVKDKFPKTIKLIVEFTNFVNYGTEDGIGVIESITWSMEQLWLAFVMKENYNKVWSGNDWIKIN